MLVDMDSHMLQAFEAGLRATAGGVAGAVPQTAVGGVMQTAANLWKERTDGRT